MPERARDAVNDMPDWLTNYLIEGDARRARERAEALGRFTEREQRLIREAAVMGFVRGTFCPVGEAEFPRDSQIVQMVLAGCLSTADRFPLIATGQWPPAPVTEGDE